MTRIVVFDRELHEPLTVVVAPASLMREVVAGSRPPYLEFLLPPEPLTTRVRPISNLTEPMPIKRVRLQFERVMGPDRNVLFWFAYPDDAELALLLRSAFLPGQMSEARRREQQAFASGLLEGVGLRA